MGMSQFSEQCTNGQHSKCLQGLFCDCNCHVVGNIMVDKTFVHDVQLETVDDSSSDDRVSPPEKPINTKHERERFLIHAILVAGKSATFGATKTELLLMGAGPDGPFDYIRRLKREGRLRAVIEETKTGNYTKVEAAFNDIAESTIDVETCKYEDLRKIHGVGPKTARYFLMYTREDTDDEYAVALDRHTLHWLRDCGYKKAPLSTPQDEDEYLFWARAFVNEARKAGMTVRQADTHAWNKFAKHDDTSRERAMKATGKKKMTEKEITDALAKVSQSLTERQNSFVGRYTGNKKRYGGKLF